MSAMFGQAKPFASLSSGLLARKGQARPAMRSQGFGGFAAAGAPLDDLGWNDMGDGNAAPAPVGVTADMVPAPDAPPPPVVQLREALKEEIEAPAPVDVDPAPAAPVAATSIAAVAERIGRETRAATGKKAAFTLRLDAERHLRLRLASAVTHRSSQALVCEALTNFLNSMPEVDELARQIAAAPATR